jgi:hypothetical protein
MTRRMPNRRSFRGGADHSADRGAAAVEFALLIPIFFALVFGMISAGIAFSRHINLSQAAREASRYGSTLSFRGAGGDVDAWLAQVALAARQAAGPASSAIGGYDYTCVAYVEPGGLQRRQVGNGAAPGVSEPGTCLPADPALGPAYVQVVLQRDTVFNAVVLGPTITITGSSVSPFEDSR